MRAPLPPPECYRVCLPRVFANAVVHPSAACWMDPWALAVEVPPEPDLDLVAGGGTNGTVQLERRDPPVARVVVRLCRARHCPEQGTKRVDRWLPEVHPVPPRPEFVGHDQVHRSMPGGIKTVGSGADLFDLTKPRALLVCRRVRRRDLVVAAIR